MTDTPRPRFRSALAELRREEQVLWRMQLAHKEAHGCGAPHAECDIKIALIHAWVLLYDALVLPSQDPRVYGVQA